jgi:hypothetical protein
MSQTTKGAELSSQIIAAVKEVAGLLFKRTAGGN